MTRHAQEARRLDWPMGGEREVARVQVGPDMARVRQIGNREICSGHEEFANRIRQPTTCTPQEHVTNPLACLFSLLGELEAAFGLHVKPPRPGKSFPELGGMAVPLRRTRISAHLSERRGSAGGTGLLHPFQLLTVTEATSKLIKDILSLVFFPARKLWCLVSSEPSNVDPDFQLLFALAGKQMKECSFSLDVFLRKADSALPPKQASRISNLQRAPRACHGMKLKLAVGAPVSQV